MSSVILQRRDGPFDEDLQERLNLTVNDMYMLFELRMEEFNLETVELQKKAIDDDMALQELTQKRLHFLQAFRRTAAMLVGEMNIRILTMMPDDVHEELRKGMASELEVSITAGEESAQEKKSDLSNKKKKIPN